MKSFKTGCLFVVGEDISIPNTISLSEDCGFFFHNYGQICKEGSMSVQKGYIYGVEITASSLQSATIIAELLCAAHAIMCGGISVEADMVINNVTTPSSWIAERNTYWYDACLMVKQAQQSHACQLALAKYYAILSACEVSGFRFDDHTRYDLLPPSKIFQAQAALLMVGAYSILEELHLQVKANKDNPSTLNGAWNPVVYGELQGRLEKHHINAVAQLAWFRRGNSERPFKKEVDASVYCSCDNADFPDFFISVIDAIFELSYIRSNYGAHTSKGNVLNAYDVKNALNLIRMVLLQYFRIGE